MRRQGDRRFHRSSPEWQTLDAAIVLLEENGRYPSDHFPVIAALRLSAGRARNR
jgi:hypothetical protein